MSTYRIEKMDAVAHTRSERIIATPTRFALKNYLYVQEAGILKSITPHVSQRQNLNSFLFLLVLSGEGRVTYQGETFPMSFGSCAYIDCKKKYSHESSSRRPWELMWVHFHGESAEALYAEFLRSNPKGVFRCSSVFHFKHPIEEIVRLHGKRSETAELLSNKYITDIITQSCLECGTEQAEEENSLQRKLPQIRTYLDAHFTEKILLQDLEQAFFVSRYHLSREFKKTFGITIGAYLLNLRIGKAKELLRYSDRPIEEIAEACGIGDTSYFTKIFRRSEQMSALEYRHKWGTVI